VTSSNFFIDFLVELVEHAETMNPRVGSSDHFELVCASIDILEH
jgi:hypothetical protein